MTPDREPGSEKTPYTPVQPDAATDAESIPVPISYSTGHHEVQDPGDVSIETIPTLEVKSGNEPFVPIEKSAKYSSRRARRLAGQILHLSHFHFPHRGEEVQPTGAAKDTVHDESRADHVASGLDVSSVSNADLMEPIVKQSVGRRFVDSDLYQSARARYDRADRELARSVAKRTKLGMFTLKGTRDTLDHEADTRAEAYVSQAELFDKIQIEKWGSNGLIEKWRRNEPGITNEQVEEKVIRKLANYHTAKQRLHNLRTQEEFRQTKGRFGKLSDWNDRVSLWYSGLSPRQRVAAGVGGVAIGAVLGGAVAATGAALGVGIAVAGGALGAGAKLYKTTMQARSGLYRGPERVERIESRHADGSLKSYDQLRTDASMRMERRRKEKVENADRTNRRARILALIAGTAIIGGGIVAHAGVVRDVADGFGDRFAPMPDQSPSPAPTGGHDGVVGDADGSSLNPPAAPLPEANPPISELPPPVFEPEYSVDALTVEDGEGWYQTFAEAGITNPTERANLLQKIGPELVARGDGYVMEDGGYGIARPGLLSKDVLDLIKNSR